MSDRRLPPTLLLLAALVAAIIAACSSEEPRAGLYVQQAWQVARVVTGHRVHVLKQGVACNDCHDLSGGRVGKVEPERCAKCHEKEARIRHAATQAATRLGEGAESDCIDCHAFTLEGTGHEQALRALDAPRGGVGGSGGSGGSSNGRGEPPHIQPFGAGDCKRCHAEAQGKTPAVEVHGTQDCLGCHKPHQDSVPKSAPCSDCHQEITTTHASAGKDNVQVCSTCHQHRHAAAVDARGTCVDCHRQQQPIVPPTALFAGGHTACVGCHRPHAFAAPEAVPCRNCHADQNVLGGSRVAAHQRCISCHAPHDVKAGPEHSCARCHTSVHPDHPALTRQGGCVGCHDAHPRGTHAKDSARSCSSCHQFASSDHAVHRGTACAQCHKPHAFALKLTGAAVCTDCHAERVQQVSTNLGHRDCKGCHQGLPHRPEALRTACATCHAKQQAAASPGHAQCGNCHEPHSGKPTAACATCHKSEHASAPVGHQTCTSCHEPHGGGHGVKACSSCHAQQAASAHGKLASDCSSCHRPHGPSGPAKPPACASCHQPPGLPGLHRVSKHQACEKCHTGHGDAAGLKREVCLSCHRDRESHFPDAPRCANCHLFTPNH